jgi:Zn finger protein HypA/HybF involved in hydrogenase expression
MLTIKTRKKRSKIWLLQEEEFLSLIKKSRSVKEALNYFGLENKGGNFRTIKQRISELNIDISHFLNNVEASNLTRKLSKDEFEQNWLIENSTRNRFHLKKYLTKFKLLDYKCHKCNNLGSWMGEQMILQLEHINGISNDNRLENLCFLCPNCHSQTLSFAGRKNKKIPI